jgi:hypothetical protein
MASRAIGFGFGAAEFIAIHSAAGRDATEVGSTGRVQHAPVPTSLSDRTLIQSQQRLGRASTH